MAYLGFVQGRRHLAKVEHGLERPDLLKQAVGELLAGADRQSWNVIDRLFGVKLGALATGLVENVDHIGFEPRKPELEHREETHRPRANNNDIGGSLH